MEDRECAKFVLQRLDGGDWPAAKVHHVLLLGSLSLGRGTQARRGLAPALGCLPANQAGQLLHVGF